MGREDAPDAAASGLASRDEEPTSVMEKKDTRQRQSTTNMQSISRVYVRYRDSAPGPASPSSHASNASTPSRYDPIASPSSCE